MEVVAAADTAGIGLGGNERNRNEIFLFPPEVWCFAQKKGNCFGIRSKKNSVNEAFSSRHRPAASLKSPKPSQRQIKHKSPPNLPETIQTPNIQRQEIVGKNILKRLSCRANTKWS